MLFLTLMTLSNVTVSSGTLAISSKSFLMRAMRASVSADSAAGVVSLSRHSAKIPGARIFKRRWMLKGRNRGLGAWGLKKR